MRQIWIPKVGGPEVLELREGATPEVGRNQVRINVKASGINFADIMARLGLYPDAPKLPAVVGYEVAGEVDQVGPEVPFSPGQRVLALTRFGGYSEQVVVPKHQVWPMPEGLGFETAAAIPTNYLTAWVMLKHLGNVRAADSVLILGAAGGVGQAACQICQHAQATILAAASPKKHKRLYDQGVAHCIDYRSDNVEKRVKELTAGRGVDIVLDPLGGSSFKRSYACLAPLGRLFLFGVSTLAPSTKRNIAAALVGLLRMGRFSPIDLMNDNRSVAGVNMGHLWDETHAMDQMMTQILHLVAKGSFAPQVDSVFSFTEATQAHRYMQQRKNFGKLVLVP